MRLAFLLALALPGVPGAAPAFPHVEEVCPGIRAAGFADRYRSANCGWVVLRGHTLLVDLPRGVDAEKLLAEVARTEGKKSVRRLVLTRYQEGDAALVASLLEHNLEKVLASPEVRKSLLAAPEKIPPDNVEALAAKTAIGDAATPIDFLPLDGVLGKGAAAVYVPGPKLLFAGPCAVNGPRVAVAGSDTAVWVETLAQLERLGAKHVVPGFGGWGGAELLSRQHRFLTELRRQVGHAVAQGRPLAGVREDVRVPDSFLVWPPYDSPLAEDIEHVYRELTVPAAPFNGRPPQKDDPHPHALVLIGDGPHEPGHIEDGLRPVFEATGVVPHFTVDVKALSAESLARVQLLVILRDGLQRPRTGEKSQYVWMTPEQEKAVVDFVEGGGGFLILHNALGLYPEGGPYLRLAGGRYTGHGPLERFQVEVVDGEHPVTRGVKDFTVADEQHAPEYDKDKVHLLLRGRSDEGKITAAGWAYEPGRGRLCHLAPGHTREALLHPMYQLLLRNAVTWCLRREGK
jgi:type 1 glutamine amidotransferase/glyoxylase-like metal-dependent hydrolase (beta-lactamase superfamily II)